MVTYGIEKSADINAENVEFSVSGISCTLATPKGRIELRSMLVGRFNLYNIMAAAGAGVALGLPLESIKEGLEHHGQVPADWRGWRMLWG